MITIDIAKDFSTMPGGRYMSEGPYSGEEFRIKFLRPKYLEAKSKNQKLRVILDGCFGYPSSFLDESFGQLAREFNNPNILDDIEIISNDQPSLVSYIKECIRNEGRSRK